MREGSGSQVFRRREKVIVECILFLEGSKCDKGRIRHKAKFYLRERESKPRMGRYAEM